MFNTYSYLIYFSCLMMTQLRCIDTLNKTNDMRVLQNILEMKSWTKDTDQNSGGISVQKIFVNGNFGMVNEFVDQSKIDNNSLDNRTKIMYIGLVCMCSESIKSLLLSCYSTDGTGQQLVDVNVVVLKTIYALVNFIDIAPNVVSLEPGFLTTLLSLNLLLVKFISVEKSVSDQNLSRKRRFHISELINLIERLTIPNCSLCDVYHEKDPFQVIHNMLDASGLNVAHIKRYIDYTDQVFRETDDFKIRVLDIFSIMNIDKSFKQKFNEIKKIYDVFLYMDLVFDYIMQTIYQHMLNTLEEFESYKINENYKIMPRIINKWVDENAIAKYEMLIEESTNKKFPIYFVDHIKIYLRIVKDIVKRNNILGLNIIKTQLNENLNFLKNKKHPGLPQLSIETDEKLGLYEYLEHVISIKDFKYFNTIYRLLKNGPTKYDVSEMKLLEMEYNNYGLDSNENSETYKIMESMYSYCFEIRSLINACDSSDSNCLQPIKKQFLFIMSIFRSISAKFGKNDENLQTIITIITNYISNNMINYPTNKEKLLRIKYLITNLMDKYRIHCCIIFNHRDLIYNKFENNASMIDHEKQICVDLKLVPILDTNMLESNFEDENNTEEVSKIQLIQIYIDALNTFQSSTFYWKGEIKTIHDIAKDLKENIFNFSSFTRYYNIFDKWLISILYNALFDFFKYFLSNNHDSKLEEKYIQKINELPVIQFPEHQLSIVKTLSNVKNLNSPANNIRYTMLLLENLQQHDIIRQKSEMPSTKPTIQTFNVIYSSLEEIYNIKPDKGTKIKNKIAKPHKSKAKKVWEKILCS